MQAEVSAVARRVAEPDFTAGSVKARILEKVHKLGRQAVRSLLFLARISTDETVDVSLKALVRDGYLTLGPGDLYELTDAGRTAIDARPRADQVKEVSGQLYTRSPTKRCRKCKVLKDPQKDFDRAPRAPDGRTFDCKECRGATSPVPAAVPMIERLAPVAATNEGAELTEAPAAERARPAPLVLTLPTIMGVYVKIEDDRVYISQPGQDCEALHLNRERGLALGRFLCANLGEAT
jgi:hypothetical protein